MEVGTLDSHIVRSVFGVEGPLVIVGLICGDGSVVVLFISVGVMEVGILDGHVGQSVFSVEGAVVIVGQSIVVLGQCWRIESTGELEPLWITVKVGHVRRNLSTFVQVLSLLLAQLKLKLSGSTSAVPGDGPSQCANFCTRISMIYEFNVGNKRILRAQVEILSV